MAAARQNPKRKGGTIMATAISISQSDIDALANAIKAAKANLPPTAFSGGSPLATFCQEWPKIKPTLETLQPIVGLIPVVGTFISAAIATLLALGNAAFSALCGAH
jgi:hypothetical protein